MPITFELRGKKYTLTREIVEEKLQYVSPKPVDKYFVFLDGRPYPPKQILAVTLNIPLIGFTTIDASRILTNLGFEVRETGSAVSVQKTESEILLEEYWNASGFTQFRFEKPFDESSKKPDYMLTYHGETVLFEVKEFHATKDDFRPGFQVHDPYKPIREKIEAARKKYKDLGSYCCCLVLYNREKPLVNLRWQYIYASMLGDLGMEIPINLGRRTPTGEPKTVFGPRGKMHRHDKHGKAIAAQNTRLSAVLVLEQFRIGYRRFDNYVRLKEQELGRTLEWEEHWELMRTALGTERDLSLSRLRVVVHHNPYASKPLPGDMFNGAYDEQYAPVNGHISRRFAGEGIVKLEENEQAGKE